MSTPLHQLRQLGQSVWYDNIHRGLLDDGRLQEYVDQYAVSGVTSNPSIFERAVAEGGGYDEALRSALERGADDAEGLFWDLAIRDIRDAADVLRDTHDASGCRDGFVSLELPPRLSHDTDGSVAFATELFERLARPNVMIKVPGTPEGVVAVEELIASGVNVNVTLLFSLEQWRAAAEAYVTGLERRIDRGDDLAVASVASFFVSRIDAKVNDRLPPALHNRLGVATAQAAYAAHDALMAGDRWRRLSFSGARPQRLLWASTSTKEPSLPETYYVSALAALGTVNTMPESTIRALARSEERGTAMPTDGAKAAAVIGRAVAEGVDLGELGRELQAEGDAAFAEAFERMLECIRTKVEQQRLRLAGERCEVRP